ncbi:nitrate ABC transporter ATPase [Eupransor demetentiae]|uniref:Uncharacterized protein n=1 Tax=Eupransor demetentiae TaxID=3109584 RepID=A0ABP0ESY7_9LACO|nr:hypothetical protein R54876_GBNLAHCA_01091 [Lactobacillaceae bacterium LMG 33000]
MQKKIEQLLEQVNQTYPGTVMTRVGDDHDGKIHLDRVRQSALADRILLELPDSTEADFLLGNELLKMLLSFNGITPQIFFALTFKDEGLDQQLIQIATRMHRTVVHAISYQELAKQGIITADTVKAYQAGVEELSLEDDQPDSESLWRLLVVMDALVFAHNAENSDNLLATLQKNYPLAYQAAKEIVEPIFAADLKQSRQIRSQMVRVFDAVDKTLDGWHLPTVNARQYVTLTSVLSERQLKQPVRQLFDIFHTQMYDYRTGQTAFVGLFKNDQQNSFVITPPADKAESAKFFKELYALPTVDLFKKLALPYIERK